jgi:hypothetical protein
MTTAPLLIDLLPYGRLTLMLYRADAAHAAIGQSELGGEMRRDRCCG